MSRHSPRLTMADVLAGLATQQWVPVVRSRTAEDAVATARAAARAGCTAVEPTREGLETWLAAEAMFVGVGAQLGSAAVDGAEEITRRAAALFGPRVGGPDDLLPGRGPHPSSV